MEQNNGLTAEELAALAELGSEYQGVREEYEYFALGRKRGHKKVLAAGPYNWALSAAGLRNSQKVVRRKKITSYTEFEVVEFDENGDAIEDSKAHALARWLVALDDPDDEEALEARRTLNLTEIIKRAREALGEEE
ncbi:hypothetical protein [Microbispora sp. NPDC049633]|uniref:hypothetical protein n=1 Tax=Microbispora sp. NPDC049633 TaxID=3154355 RepID=UPI003442B1B6